MGQPGGPMGQPFDIPDGLPEKPDVGIAARRVTGGWIVGRVLVVGFGDHATSTESPGRPTGQCFQYSRALSRTASDTHP